MADSTILPGVRARLVAPDGTTTREFYRFFSALSVTASLPGRVDDLTVRVDDLDVRVKALEHGGGAVRTILGLQSVKVVGPLEDGSVQLALAGDVISAPALSFYGALAEYGKGWQTFSGNFASLDNGDDTSSLDLADLADSNTGTFKLITRDAKGRVSGSTDGTTDDVPEGDGNLYFTDERAQAAVVVSGITDGDTDHSPSGDAVFEALAGKEPAITAGTIAQYRRGDKTWQTLNKAAVGLSNADNTSDANKPVSTAQAAAIATKEPAITAGTAAQFVRGNKTVGNTLIGGGMGTFPGNNTAGTTAVCYEVGTDVVGRGASIKSKRGVVSTNTGMVLSSHNASGDLDLVSINDDSTVNFGSTLYIDEVNGRVGIGAAPVSFSFEVNSPTGGLFLNRQSTTVEPFIILRSNSDTTTGGQIRSSATGYGIRLTTSASGQPTMLGVSPTQVAPGFDNAASSATASLRWSVVYAATSPINTSDAREKTDVAPLSADELAAAADLARAIGTYQWLASVAEKGADKARHHAGLTVQQAIAIMQAHELDPFAYGFICYDEWHEAPEQWADIPEEHDDEGNVIREASRELVQEYRPAGDRYSFRTDELLLFMARGFAARLDALEAKA